MFEQVEKSKFSPTADEESAEKAVRYASNAALFVGGTTTLLGLAALAGAPIGGSDGSAIFDGLAFLGLGFWMRSGSRLAAVSTFLLYIVGKIAALATNEAAVGGVLPSVFVGLFLVNGMRGAFALRRFRVERGAIDTSWRTWHLFAGSYALAAVTVFTTMASGWFGLGLPMRWLLIPIITAAKITNQQLIGTIFIGVTSFFWGGAIFAAAIIVREIRKPTRATFAPTDAA